MSNSPKDKKNPVGYRKPPMHTRFKPGKSGNPNGRPSGTPNLATALDRALKEKVVVNEGGQRRVVTKMEAMVANLVNKSALGEARDRQQLLQIIRVLDGDPAEASSDLELAHEDEEIIKHLAERLRRFVKEKCDEEPDKT